MQIEGNAWKVGHDIDTDAIIPGRHLNVSDERLLAGHCFEDLLPGFARQVGPGDILVAGRNFGCGSSREHAPMALKAAGIAAVLAPSFARIFYRNAFNIGLPAMESPSVHERVRQGDRLRVDLTDGHIDNLTMGDRLECRPLTGFMLELVASGGLMSLLKRGGWR
jgi:3-isopropylmalate dehydrogenase/3-isopropylmalate/(R)-2-methylmalate dehydratase small subunit